MGNTTSNINDFVAYHDNIAALNEENAQNNPATEKSQPRVQNTPVGQNIQVGQNGGKFSDILNWFSLFNLIMAVAIILVILGGNMIRHENYWGFAVVTCGLLIGFTNKKFNK